MKIAFSFSRGGSHRTVVLFFRLRHFGAVAIGLRRSPVTVSQLHLSFLDDKR